MLARCHRFLHQSKAIGSVGIELVTDQELVVLDDHELPHASLEDAPAAGVQHRAEPKNNELVPVHNAVGGQLLSRQVIHTTVRWRIVSDDHDLVLSGELAVLRGAHRSSKQVDDETSVLFLLDRAFVRLQQEGTGSRRNSADHVIIIAL